MNSKRFFPGDKSVASSVDGEESVVGCDNRHYVDQTTLNVARGVVGWGEITNPSLLQARHF